MTKVKASQMVLIEPQPVIADYKPPIRWIWGLEVPITDMCIIQANGNYGNSSVSWWNYDDECALMCDHCPLPRPPDAIVTCYRDWDDKWYWCVEWEVKVTEG